jgi:GNAT superfamily N-acetyltransferase
MFGLTPRHGSASAEMNFEGGEYLLTDDKSRLDLDVVCALLRDTYWAANRSREQIQKSIQHSVCFGLFHAGKQVGFARAVTDYATFCYLCDVIVAPEHRGRGLGKWIVECMLAHPDLQTTTQCLRTRDAHALYERFGFERTEYLRRSLNDWSKQKPGSASA